ncbi:MAG TPA: hypothetical protein VKW78_19230 [Terriglobales bacterium]|nr:hypothetical protein [Terriglobales bacterium]
MAVKAIQLGQVWRSEADAQNYLVTKVYNEVFTQFVTLRKADSTAASTASIRIKVEKTKDGVTLPGYVFTQDSDSF